MNGAVYILDTSFLLELEQIPNHHAPGRQKQIKKWAREIDASPVAPIITVPVLLEYAGHLARIKNGNIRRQKAQSFYEDIRDSLDGEGPWTIHGNRNGVLLEAKDIINLGEKFAEDFNYSVADLSVIQIAGREKQRGREVKILTFERKLRAWEDS